jgi:hypothetical protein
VTQVEAPTARGAQDAQSRGARPRRLRWWHEVLYILAFYVVYSLIRTTQGSASVSVPHALGHARDVIHLERVLGLYHELWVQQQFLAQRGFMEFWNLFYGTFHFVITVVALVMLFRRFPQRYPLWRNALAMTTGAALVGFAFYPLMPPRLLPAHYGFVDTLKAYGSLWSFDSGTMHKISNQYAAMPSLHFAWATWSTVVLAPMVKRNWARALVFAYPAATLFAIVVTANHYFLDALAGAVIFGVGALGAAVVTRHQRPVAV